MLPSAPLPHRAPRPHARRTARRALPSGASRSGKAGGPSAPLPHRLRTAGEATEAGCRAPSAVARRWSPRRAQGMRTSSVSLEMRWQESKSRSHQMREGESIGRWYRAIPPHRMWIGWDALQFGGQGLATDAEPRARLRRPDLAAAQLDWPAFGAALLLQRRRNFLETRLGAAFVDQAARCAADADAADHLVTGLDQHGAGKQQDSRYAGQRGSGRVGGELRYQFALQILLEDRPERDDGIGLATARVQRVRRGTFVFEHGTRETIAVEHSHADLVTELVATGQGLGRCLRCQQSAEFLGCSRLGLRERCAERECDERGKAKKSHADFLGGRVGDRDGAAGEDSPVAQDEQGEASATSGQRNSSISETGVLRRTCTRTCLVATDVTSTASPAMCS